MMIKMRRMRHIRVIIAVFAAFLLLSCGSGGDSLVAQHLLTVDGATNFRDFGGYLTNSSRLVNWRRLFRSSNFNGLTDEGLRQFEALGIRHVIDLRTQQEIDEKPDRLPEGVGSSNIPIIDATAIPLLTALTTGDTSGLTFDDVVEGHSTVYTDNLEEYQAIAALVMDPAMRPIDIHCAAGSMRTGFTVALVQLILGVTEVSVYEDFLLTNEVLGSTYDESLEEFRELIFANTGKEPTEQDMANLSNMVIIYSEYLEAALDHVRDVYGSIDAYIRDGLGITDVERDGFQSELVAGSTPFPFTETSLGDVSPLVTIQ